MQNWVQKGGTITFTAPNGGVTGGQGYLLGSLFGVVSYTAAAGVSAELQTLGVVTLPKDTVVSTFSDGDRVYWDNTNLVATIVQGSNREIGTAVLVNPDGTSDPGGVLADTTVRVRLAQESRAASVKVAHFLFDFAVDGGAVGAITPSVSDTIPANAVVLGGVINSPTAVTSGGAATVSVGTVAGSGAASILGSTAKTSLTIDAVLPGACNATPFKMSAAGKINITVGTAALTAGVIEGWVEYVIASKA